MDTKVYALPTPAGYQTGASAADYPARCAALKARLGTKDWCAELAKKQGSNYVGINYENAINCLDSFEFNAQRLKDTTDILLNGIEFNVFVDQAMSPPIPDFQFAFDIRGAIREIAKGKWCNEREWSEALYDVYVAMNDGHTSFTPLCFRKFLYTQAFYPIAMVDEVTFKTRYYVGGLPSPVIEADRVHIGREIIKVDGQDPYQVFWNFSQTRVGKYKDAGTRFLDTMANMSWDHKTGWSLWPGSFSSPSKPPSHKSVKWTLAAGNGRPEETIDREWYINLPIDPFTNKQDYFNNFCMPGKDNVKLEDQGLANAASAAPPSGNAGAAVSSIPAAPANQHVEDVLKNTKLNPGMQIDPDAVVNINITLPAPLIEAEGLAFFQIPDAKEVCVLMLTTFSLVEPKDNWRKAFATSMDMFKMVKCTKLVIDLTANGGGYLDLAWEAIAVLTPDPNPDPNDWPEKANRYFRDFRVTDLVSAMTTNAFKNPALNSVFKPQWLGDYATKREYEDLSLIHEHSHNRTFNKTDGTPFTMKYSEEYIELPVAIEPTNPLKNKNWGLAAKDMVMVSSGDCGSACGLVYYHLSEVTGVNGAVLGAFYKRPRTFPAFPVTEVFTHAQIVGETKLLSLDKRPDAPKMFTISAVHRIPVREGWSRKVPTIMVEYKWTDANIQIDTFHRFVLRPDNVWRGAAEAMGWVKPPPNAGNMVARVFKLSEPNPKDEALPPNPNLAWEAPAVT